MKKLSISFFTYRFFLLAVVFLLTACSSPQSVETESPVIPPTAAATNPVPTEAPPASLTPAPPDTPTPEPTSEPTNESIPESSQLLKVVYINGDNHPILWDGTSTITQLASTGDALHVRISDDGAIIVFIRELSIAEQEMWAVNSDGSDLRLLMGVEDFRALDPAALGVKPYQFDWIPGTHVIALNTVQDVDGPGLFLYDNLYFLDVDTNDLTIQLTAGTGGKFVFSPDGLQYAVIQPESISLLNTDGSNIRPDVLTYPYVLTYSEYQYYAEPIWSPDSSFLRVAIPPQDSLGNPEAATLLWEIPADGGSPVQMGAVLAQPFFIDPVHISPDLTHIAYTRLPNLEDYINADLVVANADGSSETVILTGNVFFQSWNPDSQSFVYEDNLTQETYLGRLGDANAITPLAEFPYPRNITWVDNTRFLFVIPSEAGWQLYLGTLGQASILIADLPDAFPVFDFNVK